MSTAGTFYLIPHTHWEGAVFQTREQYLEWGLEHITMALDLLKAYPEYRFALDQACYVQPFLDRFPDAEADMRRFIEEGRLQIVGGLDCMPDVNMPAGESFVRQVLYGKRFFRRRLGVDVKTGWLLDTFGSHAQMPQIMKLAGYESYWFFRGAPALESPCEFLWEGLDGTRILALWLSWGYAVLHGSPDTLPEFAAFVAERYRWLDANTSSPDRAGPAGADVCKPEAHVPGLAAEFNRLPDRPFELRISVPTDYEQLLRERTDLPVLGGEMNPVFPGSYSSRIEVKQTFRDLERLLLTAESLMAFKRCIGIPVEEEAIWPAWEPVLFNQAHDLAAGVMTDPVYEDTMDSYDQSERLVREFVERDLDDLSERIDTRGDGAPVVVWNLCGWARSGMVEVDVSFDCPGVNSVRVSDDSGREVPVQALSLGRHDDGTLRDARLAFLATDIPAMGYAVYRIHDVPEGDLQVPNEVTADTVAMENECLRVSIDAGTGAMTSVVMKDEPWEYLSGPGNVVSREPDGGDFWELYEPLDSGHVARMERQTGPQPGKAVFSTEFTGKSSLSVGPVFSECVYEQEFGAGRLLTRVRLIRGSDCIGIRTRLLNRDEFVRYQVMFPTTMLKGETVHEIPFGTQVRPDGVEFAAQNWAEYGDGTHGLAVLNRGLPGNLTVDGTMLLSLARSTRITQYPSHGGYEEGMSSDTGLSLGKEWVFDYALVPHRGDWRQAKIWRQGLEFNRPLMARKATPSAGPLPKRFAWLDVSHPNLVVSALKPGPEGSVIVRVYEAEGRGASG